MLTDLTALSDTAFRSLAEEFKAAGESSPTELAAKVTELADSAESQLARLSADGLALVSARLEQLRRFVVQALDEQPQITEAFAPFEEIHRHVEELRWAKHMDLVRGAGVQQGTAAARILECLRGSTTPRQPSDIAEELGLTRSQVSRALRSLRESGEVRAIPIADSDARTVWYVAVAPGEGWSDLLIRLASELVPPSEKDHVALVMLTGEREVAVGPQDAIVKIFKSGVPAETFEWPDLPTATAAIAGRPSGAEPPRAGLR